MGLNRALDLFYQEDRYFNAISLLVARHGRLVVEAFSRDTADRSFKRNIQSATKSVTSLVFGIAVDGGHVAGLDRTLYSIMPEVFDSDARKQAITLRHLLTMRSGLDFPNDRFSRELLMDRPRDQVRRILAKPLYAMPGDSFFYRDSDPQLISAALERITGGTLAAWAEQHLFEPLGITDWFWEANVDGSSLGGVALFLRPRDAAKIGQLVLQRGWWDGRRVVSEAWLDLSTSPQTDSDDPEYPYGFYWWTVPELRAFTAWGHGGQFIFIVPELDLLIVMTSLPNADDDDVGTRLDAFLDIARHVVNAAS